MDASLGLTLATSSHRVSKTVIPFFTAKEDKSNHSTYFIDNNTLN